MITRMSKVEIVGPKDLLRDVVALLQQLKVIQTDPEESELEDEDAVEEEGRGDHGDAVVFELRGDAAQDGVVAEAGETGEELLAALIRGEVLEQRLLADPTGHDGLGDPGGAEDVEGGRAGWWSAAT